MSLVGHAFLAFKYSTGLISDEERWDVTLSNARSAFVAAGRVAAVVTFGVTLGFILPNCFMDAPWPTNISLEAFNNSTGYVRGMMALCCGFWGYHKTFPHFWFHVCMVWDPEAESVQAFKKAIKNLFDDIMRLFVTLASLAIPAYLVHKSIQILLLA